MGPPWTTSAVADLARDLVRLDSRSFVSNLPVADRLEAALDGFEVERLDYLDAAGVAKRALVAHRGSPGATSGLHPGEAASKDTVSGNAASGGLAFSGHMDTVPDTGWQDDPWSGRIDAAGRLHGLGSSDMKGPVAAAIIAARSLPAEVPVTLLLTTDEETTKQGARVIVERSILARRVRPGGILVVEPTAMQPVRGHRSHILFTCTAHGVQAHSASGEGRNANWALIGFLAELRTVFDRLRGDPAWHDAAYQPPFSDFNPVIDNHGSAVNVTVPVATARIKFRYSAAIDPAPIQQAVQQAGERHGVTIMQNTEGSPPELPAGHPLVRLCSATTGRSPGTAPFGTDASVLQALAPCVICGPGGMEEAHKPGEAVELAALEAAVPVLTAIAVAFAKR